MHAVADTLAVTCRSLHTIHKMKRNERGPVIVSERIDVRNVT
jgi:hypothetical protein